jgi:hypothetical protein
VVSFEDQLFEKPFIVAGQVRNDGKVIGWNTCMRDAI